MGREIGDCVPINLRFTFSYRLIEIIRTNIPDNVLYEMVSTASKCRRSLKFSKRISSFIRKSYLSEYMKKTKSFYFIFCSRPCSSHIHTYIYACIYTYIHTYVHTYIHIYIHTYIHTYVRTYIHIYTHTQIHTLKWMQFLKLQHTYCD
jgi:hypothetical protein